MRRSQRRVIAIAVLGLVAALAWLRYHAAGIDPLYFQPGINTHVALARYTLGDYAGAARSLRAQLRARPEYDAQRGDPSYTALLGGNINDALQEAETALRADPSATLPAITRAHAMLESKRTHDALAALRTLLSAAPERPVNTFALTAVVETRLGDYERAIATWHRALRYGESGTRALVYVATLEAVDELLRSPDQPGKHALLAQCFRYLRYYDRSADRKVRHHAQRAIDAGDRADDGWVALGASLAQGNDTAGALAAFQAATRINPRNAEAWRQAALIHSARGDLAAELGSALTASASDDEDTAIAEWVLQLLAEKFGDHRRVISIAAARVSAGRREFPVLLKLGQAHAFLGDLKASTAAYQLALDLRPRQADILGWIAYNYSKSGQGAEALAYARRAAEFKPEWAYPYRLIASVLAEQFRYEDAIQAYETAFRLQGLDTGDLAHLCTLYHTTSRWKAGLECFETVLKRDPTNARAARMLAESRNNYELAQRAQQGNVAQ